MTDRLPDMQEVYQSNAEELAEDKVPDIPVIIQNLVRIQTLPAQSWAARSFELAINDPVQIARRDPRRKRALITVTTQTAWIGPTQSIAKQNVGFRVPAGVQPIEITHSEEIWAVADQAGSLLSIMAEYWTG